MRCKYIRISHILNINTPSYGDESKLEIFENKNFENGDICNTFEFKMSNHLGTHIDFPNHFDQTGKKVCDYEIKELVFEKCLLIEIPKKQNELVSIKDLEKFEKEIYGKDIILIKTGFEKYRPEKEYKFANPGISSEAIEYLQNFKIRALGIDTISISSKGISGEGRRAHIKALCSSNSLLLIEDMKLGNIDSKIKFKKIIAMPLFIENIDSAPATIIGLY